MNKLLMTLVLSGFAGMLLAAEPAAKKPAKDGEIQDFVLLTESRPVLIRTHLTVGGQPYATAWEAYVDRILKFLDTDADGVLNADEMKRRPPVQFMTGAGPTAIVRAGARLIDEHPLDADKDGRATRAELADWLRRSGAAPFQVGEGTSGPPGVRFINIGAPTPANADDMNRAINALLDTNRDGKLSTDELAAAPKALIAHDRDDDEVIVPSEISQIGKKPVKPAEAPPSRTGSVEYLAMQTPSAGSGLVILVNPREPGTALARRLLAKYSRTDQPSRQLTAEQIGLDRDTFDRLDADRNGSLDSEELAQFAKQPADVDLTVALGKKETDSGSTIKAIARTKGIAVETNDSKTALVVGSTRLELNAGSPDGNMKFDFNFRLKDQYINQFKTADTDNNNYLDEKEGKGNPLIRGVYNALDRDGDGMLFEKEMVEYLDKVEELQKAVRQGCFTLSIKNKGSGWFELLDRDRDGRLSVRELRQASALVKSLDKNQDGAIAAVEVPLNLESWFRHGPASSADTGSLVVVARATFTETAAKPEPKVGPTWFRKMDTNRDGDLSRREFLGTNADFARIDTDRDGLIDASEAAAATKGKAAGSR